MNFFRCSPHEPDNYGFRSLWRNISLSSQKSDCSSTISKEDLGFTESVLRTFTSPAYAYMESPFNNSVVSPLSDSYQLPDEYLHGLCRTKGLPKIELQKFPTDLVSKFRTWKSRMNWILMFWCYREWCFASSRAASQAIFFGVFREEGQDSGSRIKVRITILVFVIPNTKSQ